jgi:hypothetical protein
MISCCRNSSMERKCGEVFYAAEEYVEVRGKRF